VFLQAGTLLGIGEAPPLDIGRSESQVKELASLLQEMAPRLLRLRLADVPKASLTSLPPGPLANALRFGLETAAFDAISRSRSIPLAALLGGKPRAVPLNALVSAEEPAEAARQAQEAVAQGFSTVKVKLTGTSWDSEFLKAVREAVGPEIKLRADVNQGWSLEQATVMLAPLEPFDLEYVEQPVSDLEALAKRRQGRGVHIAADEGVTDMMAAHRLLVGRAADVLVVKAARVGGLQEALSIVWIAEKRGAPAIITSSLETGVGIAASLHLAAASPPSPLAQGLATASLLEHDLLATPLPPTGGLLSPPQGPGLGVSLDMTALERYGSGLRGMVTV
jgi:L-alanine-DL-glutamate epimerase-like enolase superfamily enzyme